MVLRVFLKCFKGANDASRAGYQLDADKVAGTPRQLTNGDSEPASHPARNHIAYVITESADGYLGSPVWDSGTPTLTGSWRVAANSPAHAILLPLADSHKAPDLRAVQSSRPLPQAAPLPPSRDSLICSHLPAAITVFNRLRAPIHQNPASLLLYGNVVPEAPDSSTLLDQIFVLQPEKLDVMWHEVMRPGGGHWKGIIRVPPQLLPPRPASEWPQAGPGSAATGNVAASPLRLQPGLRARLSAEFFSLTGHRSAVGESREGGGAAAGAEAAVDTGGARGGACGRTGSPRGAGASAAPSPRADQASAIAAAATSVTNVGCNLCGSASDPPGHPKTDEALSVRAASRLRPATAAAAPSLSRAIHGPAAPPRHPGAADRSTSGNALAWAGPRRERSSRARLASASGSAARVVPTDASLSYTDGMTAARRTRDRPHSTSGQCTVAGATSGFGLTSSDQFGHPTGTHSFKRNSMPETVGLPRPGQPCVTGRLSLLGTPQHRPNSTAHPPPLPPIPICASLELSLASGGDANASAVACQLSPAAGRQPACPLGFDLSEIPKATSAAANTQGSLSRGWDSTHNPLATSTFGLTLGAAFEGLPEAAMPASALATGPYASAAAIAATASGGATIALGPARVLDLAASTQRGKSSSLRDMSTPRAFMFSTSTGAGFVAAAAAAAAAAPSPPPPPPTTTLPVAIPSPVGGAPFRRKPSRTMSGSMGLGPGLGAGACARVLTFASSLRNAPVATQLLAEASRPGGGGGGGGLAPNSPSPRSASAKATSPWASAATHASCENSQAQQQQQHAAPVVPGPIRTQQQRQQLAAADGRAAASHPRSANWAIAAQTALGSGGSSADTAVARRVNAGGRAASVDEAVGARLALKGSSDRPPHNEEGDQQLKRQPQGQSKAWARQQGGGVTAAADASPIFVPAAAPAPAPDLPTVDWPTGLDSSSLDIERLADVVLPLDSDVDDEGDEDQQQQQQRNQQSYQQPQPQQPDDRRQQQPVALASPQPPLSSPTIAQLVQEAQGAGQQQQPQAQVECWHEVWATRAVDPVTGEEVLVLTQHDVSAKVVAERHLALVMEAEHRLLEQLFPKHILTHVTEEWIAEAERALPVSPGPGGGAGAGAGGRTRWRPVIRDCNSLATWHPQVTLLFADIRGFTPMCKQVTPREVMTMLNDLFSRFDELLDKFGVFKVETIGDCYFVAGGLIHEDEDGMAAVRDEDTRGDPLHAQKVFMFAKAMLAAAREVRMPSSGEPVQIRIGISSGPVVSGVVGTRMPRFCLFGDTVNTTSRMESTGQPGAIHASESAYALLKSEAWEATGGIEVKGKGLMRTYLWRPLLEEHEAGGGREGAARRLPVSCEEAVAALRQQAREAAGGGDGGSRLVLPAGGAPPGTGGAA